MANPFSILLHDLINRFTHGRFAPLKNQTLHLPPSQITFSIDSKTAGFQNAVLGELGINQPEERRARMARRHLRNSADVITASDFDLYTKPIASDPTIVRILDMLAKGQSWQEAGFHEWMLSEIKRKGSLDGCRNMEDVIRRYDQLDVLKDQMRSGNGLRAPDGVFGRYGKIDGIVVAVGREGNVIFCGSGKHRLALAIGNDIPSLPVSVCAVHKQAVADGKWQALL